MSYPAPPLAPAPPAPKPLLKRPWVIILLVVVALAVIGSVTNHGSSSTHTTTPVAAAPAPAPVSDDTAVATALTLTWAKQTPQEQNDMCLAMSTYGVPWAADAIINGASNDPRFVQARPTIEAWLTDTCG